MAKVNRFFKSPGVQQVRAIGLEEAMFLPSYMRQKHDELAGAAAQLSVLDSASMGQDKEAVRQLLDPIEEQVKAISSDLAKNGYDPQKAEKLMQVQAEYQKAKRDGLSKLEGRLQSFQSEKEKITEFYKDNPEHAKYFNGVLNIANQGKATIDEDGDIKVPGITVPDYSKILSSEELSDMTTKLFTAMKADSRAGDLNMQNYKDLYAVFTDPENTGIRAQRIKQLFTSTLNSMPDVKNSFKTKQAVNGIGVSQYMNPETTDPEQLRNIVRQEANILEESYDRQLFATEGITREKLARKLMQSSPSMTMEEAYNEVEDDVKTNEEYLAAKENFDIKKQELKAQIASGNYEGIGRKALNASADYDMNVSITGIAAGLAYQQSKMNTNIKSLPAWLTNPKKDGNEDGIRWDSTSIESISNIPTTLPSLDNISIDQDDNVNADQVEGNTFAKNTEMINPKTNEKYDVSKRAEFIDKGWVTQNFTPSGKVSYDVTLEGEKHVEIRNVMGDKATQARISEFKTFKDSIPYFKNMTNKKALEAIKFLKKDAEQIVSNVIFSPQDTGDTFKENYIGTYDGKVFEPSTLFGKQKFSLDNTGADETFNEVINKLGYSDFEEFNEKARFGRPTFSPLLSKYVVSAMHSDGTNKNVYIEPSDNVKRAALPITNMYKAYTSMEPMVVADSNPNTNMYKYIVRDYENNQAYVVSSKGKINSPYEEVLGMVRSGMGTPFDAEVTNLTRSSLLENKNFKAYIDVR